MTIGRLQTAPCVGSLVVHIAAWGLSTATGVAWAQVDRTPFKFDLGPGKVAPGYTQVVPTTVYTQELGYGLEPGSAVSGVDRGGDDPLRSDFITSDRPFLFSVKVPEGNYRVTVTLGDRTGESTTTVKAELRRLMLEKVHTASGQSATRTFSVNIRTPRIAGDGEVRLKDRDPNALAAYTSNLRQIVAEVRKRGATPVLVTSMERKAGIENDTLAGYPDGVRQVAREDNAALIDLHAMSKVLYKALGPNLDKAFQDGTHHNNYGAYELAQCVVQGIKDNKLDLARHIVDDFKAFDPSKPDPVGQFQMPASPGTTGERPLGN